MELPLCPLYSISMQRIIFAAILAIEVFALFNRGGGPLLAHLFLTAAAFVILCICLARPAGLEFKFGLSQSSYILFLLCFAASLMFSLIPGFGLAELLLFANTAILLIVLSGLKLNEKDLNFFITGLIAIAVIDVLIGFFIYTKTPYPRFTGTFIDLKEPYTSFANDFADFILIILPICLWQFFKKHSRSTTTVLAGIASAVLFSGFLLSFSRGAWISLLALGILFGIWRAIRRREINRQAEGKLLFKAFMMRFLGLLLAIIIIVNGLQITRGKTFPVISLLLKASFQADEGGSSITERLEFWEASVKMIAQRPLLGSGVYSFKYLFPKYQKTFGITENHPHDIFLKMGVENGLPAMIFFIIFLASSAVFVLKFLWKRPGSILVPISLGAIGAFGHNMIDFNFITSNFTLAISFIGICLSCVYGQTKTLKYVPLYTMLVLSLSLLFLAANEGFYNIYFKQGRTALAAGNYEEAAQKLESAQSLAFERDRVNYLSLAYQKQHEKTKEEKLLEGVADTTIDASLVARLGELYVEEKNYAAAEGFFEKALRMDGLNRLRYYYLLADVELKKDGRIAPVLKEKIIALLDVYKEILAGNKHFTILTDNPEYASKLYGLLGMEEERKQIEAVLFDEIMKFTLKYGSSPKLLSPI